MADETPTSPATGTPTTPVTGTPNTPPSSPATDSAPLTVAERKALGGGEDGLRADLATERQKRHEFQARLKELEPLAAKAKELEDAQKTEQQRLTEQLQTAQAESATSTSELLRLQVALAKAPAGMDNAKIVSLAERLRGATREELEADAEALFADFVAPASATVAGGPQTPVEQLRPGALPTTPQATLAQQIAAAEQAGDWAQARQLKSQQLYELQQASK